MTLYTSGDWKVDYDAHVAHDVFDFCCEQWDQLTDAEVEVNQCDLTDDRVKGWFQVDEDGEFLIHIHNDLSRDDYMVTLIHELVHVKQTLTGLLDYDRREEEAVIWEKILFHRLKQKLGELVPLDFLSPKR